MELEDIQSEAANIYGVDADDIVVDVVYQTSGTIEIEIGDDTISDEIVAENLEDHLATLLGIHESEIEVTIVDDVATYIITSESVESAENMQATLADDTTTDALNEFIGDSLPIEVSDVNVEDEVVADVSITIDTTDADNNLNDAVSALVDLFESQDFVAVAESN